MKLVASLVATACKLESDSYILGSVRLVRDNYKEDRTMLFEIFLKLLTNSEVKFTMIASIVQRKSGTFFLHLLHFPIFFWGGMLHCISYGKFCPHVYGQI